MNDKGRSACPDPTSLEAYVAAGADVDRGAIERHAAGCRSCREALVAAGLARGGDAEDGALLQAVLAAPARRELLEALRPLPSPEVRRARWDPGRIARWAAGPIAAACALVVAVYLIPANYDRMVATRLAGERRIEGRPSIVLPHVDFVPVRGTDDVGGDYRELLGELLRRSSSPDAARALAVLSLWQHGPGDVADARRRLQRLPEAPARSNDLALAELVEGKPERALPLLRSALAEKPDMLPALFNEALALQELGRRQEAIAAWRTYLDRGGAAEPGWADEAREKLRALQDRP